jgi:hypothetical protein
MNFLLPSLLILAGILPLNANSIEATFVGVNGTVGFSYYVGPYYGKLNQQSVVLDCVDFANDVSFGQQWAANLSHIISPGDLSATRFGGRPDALRLYQEAAYLTLQYSLNPASAYGDIQATIWQLFDGYAPTPSTGYWLNLAQANYGSVNYDNFFVVTNTGPVNPTGQVQEFLTVLNPAMPIYPAASPPITPLSANNVATPEPSLFLPLALALVLLCAVGLVSRLRRRSRPG